MTALHDHPLLPIAAATIEIGSVLHQLMSLMEASERDGHTAPDALPRGEVLHTLVLDVLEDALKDVDIPATTRLLDRIGTALAQDILMVSPEMLLED